MTGVIGHVENGAIHLSEQVDWSDGQRALVIALPVRPVGVEAPPDDLLEKMRRSSLCVAMQSPILTATNSHDDRSGRDCSD